MTEQTKSNPPPTSRPIPHPKELSPEYHKAHKQLMLWAAILFVWEFVGIDLEKAKDTEGYAGAIVKSIKSPQAVPWVLLLLVGYFLIKCYFEWAQCDTDRRKMRYARADFVSGLVLGLGSITLYFWQALSQAQLADTIQRKRDLLYNVAIGLLGGLVVGRLLFYVVTLRGLKDWRRRPIREFWPILVFLWVIVTTGVALAIEGQPMGGAPFSLRVFLLSLGVAAAATWIISALWQRWWVRWLKGKSEVEPDVAELNHAKLP